MKTFTLMFFMAAVSWSTWALAAGPGVPELDCKDINTGKVYLVAPNLLGSDGDENQVQTDLQIDGKNVFSKEIKGKIDHTTISLSYSNEGTTLDLEVKVEEGSYHQHVPPSYGASGVWLNGTLSFSSRGQSIKSTPVRCEAWWAV